MAVPGNLLGTQRVDLIGGHALELLDRIAVELGGGPICFHDRPRLRLDEEHDGRVVGEHLAVELLALAQSLQLLALDIDLLSKARLPVHGCQPRFHGFTELFEKPAERPRIVIL